MENKKYYFLYGRNKKLRTSDKRSSFYFPGTEKEKNNPKIN
jgi:hypothetical protein